MSMSKSEMIFWGIHAGQTGDADGLFLGSNQIAIGWHELGDLSAIGATRDAFKAKVIAVI